MHVLSQGMNKKLQLAVRNAVCSDCKMCQGVEEEEVCTTGNGPNNARIGVVTSFPLHPRSKLFAELHDFLRAASIDPDSVMWLSAIKCGSRDQSVTKTVMKACRPYLQQELAFLKLDYVLTVGSEALFAATGKSGIMKYRGRTETHNGTTFFPTISPSMLSRNPGLTSGFQADLRYFGNLTQGINQDDDPWHLPYDDQWTTVDTQDAVRSCVRALTRADAASYDIETVGASHHLSDARIVSLSITTLTKGEPHVWAIPLYHPQSVWANGEPNLWRKSWKPSNKWIEILCIIGDALRRVPRLIAHNAKYDTKWMRQFGVPIMPTFDTIVAAALLDENRPKGLKPLALQLLGADPWAIETRELLTTELDEVLDYNGLDTWHDMRLYLLFKDQLLEDPRLARFFSRLMMPVVRELVRVEMRGIYVDQKVLHENWQIARETLKRIEEELAAYLPDDSEVPDRLKKKGQVKVNYGASNFARWWLFEYLEWPILARGKMKEDGSPGQPSMAEGVLMVMAERDDPVAKLLLERVQWQKFHTSFFTPYAAQITEDSRIHTTFKPWGTVTGRMSSGKEDKEKITGSRERNNQRGVNTQQVPRNKIVRGVFGAAPGWTFVEADYSQIELRIAAFLADEKNLLRLYAMGQDVHMAMAMKMTGKPASLVTPEERKKAKAVNFGFLYGMGWAKFVLTAFLNYGVHVSEEESRAFRTAFFDQFPGLPMWHRRQRALARKYKRVQTPMGRIRHLPDIDSMNEDVRAEAERQAINSPVQAMASDMALLSMVHTARHFRREGIEAYPVGAVHDAVNFEIRNDHVHLALPVIKEIMEELPLADIFDCHLTVPIVADLKVGKHWGGATEVPSDIILGSRRGLRNWLKEQDVG
jgi:DNA polymerase I-like protein with 3'-5' exonuclease and polymerase domains